MLARFQARTRKTMMRAYGSSDCNHIEGAVAGDLRKVSRFFYLGVKLCHVIEPFLVFVADNIDLDPGEGTEVSHQVRPQ